MSGRGRTGGLALALAASGAATGRPFTAQASGLRTNRLRGVWANLLDPETGLFTGATFQGNGTHFGATALGATNDGGYAAGGLDGVYAAGIPGLLDRVDDSSFIGGSGELATAAQQNAWKFTVATTHKVFAGAPRTQMNGFALEVGRRYLFDFSFRLDQPGGAGYDFDQESGGRVLLFQLHQESGYGAQQASASPAFALIMEGAKMYWSNRQIDSEMGSDQGTHVNWADGDTNLNVLVKAMRPALSTAYNDVVLDITVDGRGLDKGGRGRWDAWVNNQYWSGGVGPTCWPTASDGQQPRPIPKFGLYNFGFGSFPANTLNSGVGMTATRGILFRKFRIMEAA